MEVEVKESVLMCNYTTLKVGGEARYFVVLNSKDEVEMAGRFAKQTALPFLVLGSGSNILFSDNGYHGIVFHNQIKGRQYTEDDNDQVTLVCQAGEILDEVIADTVDRGFWGLENLSAIPGTVGAVPVQNVGAYGVEVSDLITFVETYDVTSGVWRKFTRDECRFGYRDSFFKTSEGRNHIIVAVHFNLQKKPVPKISYADLVNYFSDREITQSAIRKVVVEIRSNKFPDWHETGTAGSFFKNPIISTEDSEVLLNKYPNLPIYKTSDSKVKISLGYILDKICNLKGYRKGDVALFDKQALVLINLGSQNAAEIKSFSEDIIKKVYNKTGVTIIPEVNIIE
ncbi:MAG: UDP-N-acetylmuramate dehydrogenase [Candidatus Nomurabacteria bacterium]|nr:UDP-N-acetylmuramate dehydrogenase [Candidatus Nomurabacteria bacterium]USN88122.1 MAG: UDP-N-acetylmuramate dehydrogenase [Candidatus Nomurabacteria bacterium]